MYPTKKLWEVCEIKKWKKVNYSEQWKYNYIDIGILRTNIIEQYTNDEWIFCNKNDILIAWDGSKSGTVGFWLEWVIGSTLAKITIDTKMFSSEFIGKFLQGNFDYLNKNTSGAAIPHLRKDILINLEIPLPPLSTQKLIVEKLDMIFVEIEKSKNLLQKNLQNVDEMNKSVLEKIFANDKWERKKLGEVCDFNYWKAFPAWAKNITGNFPVYWANGIMYMWDNFLIDAQSIIVGRKWSVGALTKTSGKFWVSDVAYYVIEKQNTVLDFLYYFLKKSNLQQFARGVKPGLNRNEVYNLKIPLPPLETQKLIVEKLDNIFAENQKLKNLYQAQIKNLDEMKQSFLKKAFAGELV